MRHIKTFSVFESKEADRQLDDLKNLSLDISDREYKVTIDEMIGAYYCRIQREDGEPFYMKDISYEFDRMTQWAEEEGMKTTVIADFGGDDIDALRKPYFLEKYEGYDFISLTLVFQTTK